MTMDGACTHQVAVSFDGASAFVRVIGHVTRETAPLVDAVLATLRGHPVQEILVDLTRVSAMDLDGARCLARAQRHFRGAEVDWAVRPATKELLDFAAA